jgi:cystathionine beta-lyase/cystathionine gamma-synthase
MKRKNNLENLAEGTRAVHAGEDHHGKSAALTTPIAQASVFALPNLEEMRRFAEGKSDAYFYTRYGNPTTTAAEQKIAALESFSGAPELDCIVTASGQAATLTTVLATCQAGDEIVSMLDVYGGSLKLFEQVLPRFGIKTQVVPFDQLGRIEPFLGSRTRLLFLESPTNPTLRCVDLGGLCESARRRHITVVVDNTFATPILQKPIQLGADVVLHSATKYLGGHSDLTAGAIVGTRSFIAEARKVAIQAGGCLDPFASYLLIRGLKTLELRVERGCHNAAAIVKFLLTNKTARKKVARVMYPGLQQNDGHVFARRQMRDYGTMLAIELKGGQRAAEKFIDGLKLWYLAPSLGGVESTVSYPVLSSHVGFARQRLEQMDVSPATVRLSVGIENATDLIEDLEQALGKS